MHYKIVQCNLVYIQSFKSNKMEELTHFERPVYTSSDYYTSQLMKSTRTLFVFNKLV